MTQRGFPWSGAAPGDAGPYTADLFSTVLRGLFNTVNNPDSGVLLNTGVGGNEALIVEATSPASANVAVRPGMALVHGTWYENDAIVNVPIAANNDVSGDDRIDLIVLEKDWIAQTIRIQVNEGTVDPSPVPPALVQTDGVVWQIPLAEIYVTNLFTSISSGDITDMREQVAPRGLYDAARVYVLYNPPSAITTTSTTFVDVDAANIIANITTREPFSRIIAICGFHMSHGSGNLSQYDLILDSTTRAGHATDGLVHVGGSRSPDMATYRTIVGLWSNVPPGAHTVKLQFRRQTGTLQTRVEDWPVTLLAMEV